MKKLASLAVILVMLFATCALLVPVSAEVQVPADASKWDGVVPTANVSYAFEGEGTEEKPYLIKSAAELAQFAANVRENIAETTYSGKFFKLTVDIDIDNKEWYGIGGCCTVEGLATKDDAINRHSYFAGTFDGDGHKIYNFALATKTTVTNAETGLPEEVTLYQQGLFGMIMGATIKNIGIESGNITLVDSNRSGALVGVGRCGFLIDNCYNKANLSYTMHRNTVCVGALTGQIIDPWTNANNLEKEKLGVYKSKTIQNCYNTGDITITWDTTTAANEMRVGSICGQYCGGAPELINVYSICTINVTDTSVASTKNNHNVGGITGAYMDTGYLENVYFKGAINLTSENNSAKFTPGFIMSHKSGATTSDPFETEGKINVGYCPVGTSSASYGVGKESAETQPTWIEQVADVVIPKAEGEFIVLIHEPEPDPIETNAPETNAPETNKPAETTSKPEGTNKPEETKAPAETKAAETKATEEKKSGCGSVVSMSGIVVLGIISCGFAITKKSKEQ